MSLSIADALTQENDTEVTLNGWVQDFRVLKTVSFIVLRDHTGVLQVTVKKDKEVLQKAISSLQRETVVSVRGKLNKEALTKNGIEVIADSLTVLNTSATPLPLGVIDKVNADIETRLNNRFIDLRKEENNLIFRSESEVLWGIRKYLHEQKFIEVHTPKIVAAATEGGADLFPVQYFEKNAYLNQSPQLYKEILISAGFNRVFEVGPAFRAEKHNTPRHLNEFTSIDIEMGFSDHTDAMRMLQESIKSGIRQLKSTLGDSLSSHGINLPEPPDEFPKITYNECIELLSNRNEVVNFGSDFTPENLKIIGSEFPSFYFITEWPSELRAFYTMPKPGQESLSNSFDLQFKEFEITSGAQRVHDPDMLELRFRKKGLNPEDFSFYSNAFRYGMPPHAGWGLGLERLTMIMLNMHNIREVTLFPRDRTRISP